MVVENVIYTDNTFTTYPSIENSYRPEYIERLRNNGLENEKWLITEKVHGSNTQISYDGETVYFGTRNHELEENENCYNLVQVLTDSKIDDKIKDIYVEIYQLVGSIKKVILFGEICGGQYPHVDVPKVKNASKVQKGVYYAPDNKWLMFDICYVTNDGEKTFLSGKHFIDFATRYSIRTVPILAVADNLTEALTYSNAEPSRVGTGMYGLPELEDNIMEGVVIRCYDRDVWTGQHRAIIKNKNDRFAEKSHERKHNVQQEELPEYLKNIMETALQYVTENRIDNVISHLGEIQLEDIGKVIGLTNQDVIKDFQKDTGLLNTLEKVESKKVTKAINTAVANLVRKIIFDRLTTK